MNKLFKLIWNEVLGVWVVVLEFDWVCGKWVVLLRRVVEYVV